MKRTIISVAAIFVVAFLSSCENDDNTIEETATNIDGFYIFNVNECPVSLTRPCNSTKIREGENYEFIFNMYVDKGFATNTVIKRTIVNTSLDGFTLTSGGEALSAGQSVTISDSTLPITTDEKFGHFQDRILFDAEHLGTFRIELRYETGNNSIEEYNYSIRVSPI